MKTTQKMVCAPIATLTLIGSLIGGASAASLVTWTINNPNSATATMGNGVVITATASNGATFDALHQSTDTAWSGDFGNSFFPSVTSGNGLDLLDPQNNGQVDFVFSSPSPNTELWFSNTIVDLTASGGFSTIDLNESTQSGFVLLNTGSGSGSGPNDPVQSAGRIVISGSPNIFSLRGGTGSQEIIRLGIVNVPEPSSALLFGLGSLGLVFRRSRR